MRTNEPEPSRDQAELIETTESEMLLVGGDLEHRVRRRVADGLAGADMLFAELGDDLGSGSVAIPEDAGQARFLDERLRQLSGK